MTPPCLVPVRKNNTIFYTRKFSGIYWRNKLVLFKAQLGEAFLEFLIFFSSYSSFIHAQPALKTPKPALKKQNWHLSVQAGTGKRKRSKPALKRQNRYLTEGLGELCLQIILIRCCFAPPSAWNRQGHFQSISVNFSQFSLVLSQF